MVRRPPSHSRASVVSSFTVIKGAMIEETYRLCAVWDQGLSKFENFDRMVARNDVGATSQSWLRDVRKVLNRRFDPGGRDAALVTLARGACPMDVWKPILLWHITRDEFLVRDFLVHWLYPLRESGTLRVRADDLLGYLGSLARRGGVVERPWSTSTVHRVAAGLLRMAADFDLLRGGTIKQFAPFSLPESSFLYLLHAMREHCPNPAKLVALDDWRMYAMTAADVEHEILRLHQFRQLEYHAAGSLAQLTLPCASAREFAERMVA